MPKPYRVLVKNRGGWKLYAKCRSKDEAILVMDNLNAKRLNKIYKRAQARGRQPSHEAKASAYQFTCIQYNEAD